MMKKIVATVCSFIFLFSTAISVMAEDRFLYITDADEDTALQHIARDEEDLYTAIHPLIDIYGEKYNILDTHLSDITVTETSDNIFNVDYILTLKLVLKNTQNEPFEVNMSLRTQFDHQGNFIKQLYEANYGYTEDISVILPDSVKIEPLFSDVDTEAWYYDACQYVGLKGIFQGMGDGTFAPEKQMTIAMFLQALANNTENYNAGSYNKPLFGVWYADVVNWAYSIGLIDQKELSIVERPITREQTAKLIKCYADITGYVDMEIQNDSLNDLTSYYRDYFQISSSAADAVLWCTLRGFMQGDSGFFRPSDILTRAQAAQLFKNAKLLMEKTTIS